MRSLFGFAYLDSAEMFELMLGQCPMTVRTMWDKGKCFPRMFYKTSRGDLDGVGGGMLFAVVRRAEDRGS